jgi:hypothetical protein
MIVLASLLLQACSVTGAGPAPKEITSPGNQEAHPQPSQAAEPFCLQGYTLETAMDHVAPLLRQNTWTPVVRHIVPYGSNPWPEGGTRLCRNL